MGFKSLTDNLEKISHKVEDYSKSTTAYYKLRLFKSAMKGGVSLVNLLVFGSLSLFVLLFLSIGIAFWINSGLDSNFIGFIIVGGFYGLILILMYIFGRKWIEKKILYTFSGLLSDDSNEPLKRNLKKISTDNEEAN